MIRRLTASARVSAMFARAALERLFVQIDEGNAESLGRHLLRDPRAHVPGPDDGECSLFGHVDSPVVRLAGHSDGAGASSGWESF